jgi:ABC-type polysaccharide/polyol phosphate export permease
LVRLDLRTRYRRSVLGMGWSLLHPIAMTAILCTVFHKVFHANIREYGPFLLAGLACWNFLGSVVTQGCQCFFQGEPYIRQYPAPLAVYPLRTALAATVHLWIALAIVIAMCGYMKGFGNLLELLSLLPALVLLFLLGWSLAVMAGVANVHFRDAQHLCEIGLQMLFYATPVMYQAQMLRDNHMGWMVNWNPLVAFLALVREPILEGRLPALETFAVAGATVLATLAAAGFTLARLQKRLIFHL